MGTSSTSPTSSATNPAATPLYFTGVSTYSNDFQSIIQRAVQIANLPVESLQNQESTVNSQQQALTALEPTVSALGNDVANLGTLAASQGLSASSSDSTTVSVVNTGATSPATYTISNIGPLATAASETTLQGYSATQSVSSSGYVNLVVGSNNYLLNLTASGQNTASGLAQAINSANAGVSATVLTSGSTQYVTISANRTGATTLQLNTVTPADLITNSGSGYETSLQAYPDTNTTAVSQSGQLQLTVGSNTYSLNLTSGNNNLTGLEQAINNAGAGVTASIGQSGSGSFYLALTATNGATNIQLNDLQNPADLISNTNQGSNATFKVNGISVTESTNNITDVIPGVSFSLLNTTSGSQSVTLSLTPDASQLSNALQTMVTDYNTLLSAVQAQQGQNAGPLQGNLIINQISSAMQDLVTYWNPVGNSTIHSLSDLGVTFNDNGQLSFDAGTFSALSDTQISDAFNFLGSANSGFAALANNFTQLSDPITGMIETQIQGYQTQTAELNDQITTAQDYVNQVQQTATQEMQTADALVAQLQEQQNSVDASVQSLNYVLYGRQPGLTG